ncbi:MAG: DUF177 domain-containing protein [Trueperaceae bacterium]|nr:MAG: DUF177 domain-containing protein [Trueperaceae bacterium]
MVSRPDATLHLASLLTQGPGSASEVEGQGLLEPGEALLESYDLRLAEPLAWELVVRRAGGEDDFLVEGRVSGSALLECRRCLVDVPTDISVSLIFPMVYKPGQKELVLIEGVEDAEETLSFGDPSVDFTELLLQLFAINLPLTVLCKESCRGLSLDGVNLNEHPDQETKPQKGTEPSPFEVLKDFDL